MKPKTKLLIKKENIGENSYELGLGKITWLWHQNQDHLKKKIDTLDSSKLKIFKNPKTIPVQWQGRHYSGRPRIEKRSSNFSKPEIA